MQIVQSHFALAGKICSIIQCCKREVARCSIRRHAKAGLHKFSEVSCVHSLYIAIIVKMVRETIAMMMPAASAMVVII